MIEQMQRSLEPSASKKLAKILCYYRNNTDFLQVLKIRNIPNFKFEKVVFPGERLLFEAIADAELEIEGCREGDVLTWNTISCDRLQAMSAEVS